MSKFSSNFDPIFQNFAPRPKKERKKQHTLAWEPSPRGSAPPKRTVRSAGRPIFLLAYLKSLSTKYPEYPSGSAQQNPAQSRSESFLFGFCFHPTMHLSHGFPTLFRGFLAVPLSGETHYRSKPGITISSGVKWANSARRFRRAPRPSL